MSDDARPILERLMVHIRRDENGCWLWTAAVHKATGYGSFWVDGRNLGAHRVAYSLLVGEIPDGLHVDHLCRVRHCVNPEHLEPVAPAENTRRGAWGVLRQPKTHCPHGHEFTPENTYLDGQYQKCRTCHLARSRKRYATDPEYRERAIARARKQREAASA